jgi:hypothetical protein
MKLVEVYKTVHNGPLRYLLGEETLGHTSAKVAKMTEHFWPVHRVRVNLVDGQVVYVYRPDAVCYKEDDT